MGNSDEAEAFDIQRTDPGAWYELARTLRIAAEPVRQRFFEIAVASQNDEANRLGMLAYSRGYMLLTGLAFENLLKAIALFRHHSLNEFPRARGGHGLTEIAKWLNLELLPAERSLLRRLEEYVHWAGRYPVPEKAGTYVTSDRKQLAAVQSDDPEVSKALFERLAAQLVPYLSGGPHDEGRFSAKP
jgi:hypothetical protein